MKFNVECLVGKKSLGDSSHRMEVLISTSLMFDGRAMVSWYKNCCGSFSKDFVEFVVVLVWVEKRFWILFVTFQDE